MKRNLLYHLQQWLKILLEFILYVVITFMIAFGLMALLRILGGSNSDIYSGTSIDPMSELWYQYVPLIVGALVALYIVHRYLFDRPLYLTGFVRDRWLVYTGIGAFIAFILLLVGFLLLWIFGQVRIDAIEWEPLLFFGFLIFFVVQSAFEEVVARAFLIPTVERRSNVMAALVVSSLFFAIVHGSNPNVTTIALINIFLAGGLLGILFIIYRSIWPAIGLHLAWNFLQGTVFGYEVSGLDVYSLLNTTEVGNDYLTGGSFGYEGSVLAMVSLAAMSAFLYFNNRDKFVTLSVYSHHKTPTTQDA